jgi:hypothetical protein
MRKSSCRWRPEPIPALILCWRSGQSRKPS